MFDDNTMAPMRLWLKLPAHLRRGFLRLYVAVSVPWVAWFGYQILDALQRGTYGPGGHSVSGAFWSLLIVPVGGPILFWAIVWVLAGFRKLEANRSAARSEPRQSPIHEKYAAFRGTPAAPKIQAAFRKLDHVKLDHLMTDEGAQLEGLPEPIRSEVLKGDDCDAIAGGAGEFGRDPRNPIPVNGPLGEIIYLSNLNTSTAKQIMFHRLGSIRQVDAYETVSFDGAVWDILFFDPYHPRKSRQAPIGYRIAADAEREKFLLGADLFVASFPDQLSDAIANTYERWFGGRVQPPKVREAAERMNFKRPAEHLGRLNLFMALLDHKASS